MADRHDITFADGKRTSGRRLNNWGATTSPTAYDDTDAHYEVGSRWVDTIMHRVWTCVKDDPGFAVWVEASGTGSGAYAGDYVVEETSYGLASAYGTSEYYSRADHTHGTPAGGGGDTYHHSQGSADTTWTINHNLGRNPVVSVLDSAGSQIEVTVNHTSINQVVLTLSYAVSGTADLS